eukprot:TRINITY_DN74913_c0_g1_i1.p1 TRINITY_DN74913_c0_g1~~TRINITY_DN74913_c0_g1_i1.p1  ORF type:complete len:790 (+),score=125.72 TRINITY_DN74913_c0_g1_i1:145-2514(+)
MLVGVLALACLQNVVGDVVGRILPRFVFPDEGDPYFGGNAQALKASLDAALDRGCMNSWRLDEPTEVAILFRHDRAVPAMSDFFIQYQMEQVAASPAEEATVGFMSFADHPQYKTKLCSALQVWEWSPRHLHFLGSNLPETMAKRIQYMPLWSAVDVDSGASCDEILDSPSCQSRTGTDVFFFGAASKPRQALCKAVDVEMGRLKLHGLSFSHECLFNTFGEALHCKICKAQVIYSEHSRTGAVLEQHRINPLLALGKAVVTTPSADDILDSSYSSAVEFAASEDIPQVISRLLLNETARFELEWRANAFARKMKIDSHAHVCSALNSLADMVGIDTLSTAKTWLQEHALYNADRRLSTNASNASSTPRPLPSANSTPMPSVMPPIPMSTTPPSQVCVSLPAAEAVYIGARYDVGSVVQEFSHFRSITNDLQVWQSNLWVLTGLDFIECTMGSVRLKDNFDLALLSGLNRLKSVVGSMEIKNNSKLTTLLGINGLSLIKGDLKVHGNPTLESAGLIGLMGLRRVGGRVEFINNPRVNCEEVYRMCSRLETWPEGDCVCISQSENRSSVAHVHNVSLVFTDTGGSDETLDKISQAVSNALADMANIDYDAVTSARTRASWRRLRGAASLGASDSSVLEFQLGLTEAEKMPSLASLSGFAASPGSTKKFIDDHVKLLEVGTQLADSVGVLLLLPYATGVTNSTNGTSNGSNEGLENAEQATSTSDKNKTNGTFQEDSTNRTAGGDSRPGEETTTTRRSTLWKGNLDESVAQSKSFFFELALALLGASVSWD